MENDASSSMPSTSSDGRNKLIYAVIEFNLDGTLYISSCPILWINNNTCRWPSKKGIERKAIMNQMTPEKDWLSIENIRILGKYNSYKDALYYEKKKTITSDESSDDATVQKRKSKKNFRYRDDSISPPPIYQQSHLDFYDDSVQNILENVVASPELDKTLDSPIEQFPMMEQIIADAEITIVNEKTSEKTNDDIWNLLMQVKVQHEIIIDRLTHIEKMFACTGINARENQITQNLPSLPLNTVVDLNELEEEIKKDEHLQNCFLNYLQFIGGSDAKACTYRCLEKIFSNYVGQFCSWTGKGGNVKVSDMQVLLLIKRAVKSSFAEFTDHQYENTVRAWFNHAKTRYLRQKNI